MCASLGESESCGGCLFDLTQLQIEKGAGEAPLRSCLQREYSARLWVAEEAFGRFAKNFWSLRWSLVDFEGRVIQRSSYRRRTRCGEIDTGATEGEEKDNAEALSYRRAEEF